MQSNMLWFNLKEIYKISKPNLWWIFLWLYVVGIIIAVVSIWRSSGSDYIQIINLSSILFLIYFTLPANLLFNAIYYLYDDIDQWRSDDIIMPPKFGLLAWIGIMNLPFILFFILPNPESYLCFILWIICVIVYQIPKFNTKETIFLDSITLTLIYYLPVLLGYFVVDLSWISWFAILGWFARAISLVALITSSYDRPMYKLFGKQGNLIYTAFFAVLGWLLLYVNLWYISIIWSILLVWCSIWYYFKPN